MYFQPRLFLLRLENLNPIFLKKISLIDTSMMKSTNLHQKLSMLAKDFPEHQNVCVTTCKDPLTKTLFHINSFQGKYWKLYMEHKASSSAIPFSLSFALKVSRAAEKRFAITSGLLSKRYRTHSVQIVNISHGWISFHLSNRNGNSWLVKM